VRTADLARSWLRRRAEQRTPSLVGYHVQSLLHRDSQRNAVIMKPAANHANRAGPSIKPIMIPITCHLRFGLRDRIRASEYWHGRFVAAGTPRTGQPVLPGRRGLGTGGQRVFGNGAKRPAAASSDWSLLVTTTARPYGVTRQIAQAATGQDHAHKRYCTGLRTSAHRTSDTDIRDWFPGWADQGGRRRRRPSWKRPFSGRGIPGFTSPAAVPRPVTPGPPHWSPGCCLRAGRVLRPGGIAPGLAAASARRCR
jgi:hypothetical protein